MALSYGQSFSFSPSRIWTNEPLLDAKDFVHKGITATLDFSNPSTRAGLTGSASQGNGVFGHHSTQNKLTLRVVSWIWIHPRQRLF